MPQWKREVYRLPEGHEWSATPGYQLLVLDRGAVVLEFPHDWFVEPGRNQTDIRDRATAEESTCVLSVSCMRLPPVDWTGLPLRDLLLAAVEGEEREYISRGTTIELRRGSVELAWTEQRFVDERERREARGRVCLARGEGIQCLITLDFWPEDEPRLAPVWENVVDSLRLGVPVHDPPGSPLP